MTWHNLPQEEREEVMREVNRFNNIKTDFNKIENYAEKLKFWYDRKLINMTYAFDYSSLKCETVHEPLDDIYAKGKKWKKLFYENDTVIFDEVITIIPSDALELRQLIFFYVEDIYVKFSNYCNSQILIENYWDNMSRSIMPEELLKSELGYTEKFISTFPGNLKVNFSNSLGRIMFKYGYDHILYANVALDVNDIFVSLYEKRDPSEITELYKNPTDVFAPIFIGVTYAEYKAFLLEQWKRYVNGESINNVVLKNAIDQRSVKLQWNTDKRVLYDIFAQLTLMTNGNGEPIIKNSLSSLANFLYQNVEGLKSIDLVQRELEKMRSKEGFDRPKRNRIDIKLEIKK